MHIHSHVVGAEARTSCDNWDNFRNYAQELRGPSQGPRSPQAQRGPWRREPGDQRPRAEVRSAGPRSRLWILAPLDSEPLAPGPLGPWAPGPLRPWTPGPLSR